MRSALLIIWSACSHLRCSKLPDNKAPEGKPSGFWRSRRHDDGGYFLIPPDPPLMGGASPTVAPERDLSFPTDRSRFPARAAHLEAGGMPTRIRLSSYRAGRFKGRICGA